jgi:phage head maturation protease
MKKTNDMHTNCEIIRDLIPLCAEGLCSDDSKALIEEHIRTCEECRKLYEEIKGGYTTKMSFGFIVKTDERKSEYDHEYNKTVVLRTITAISKLYDVSAVSIPANDATEISARSFSDGVIREAKAERLKREIKRSKLMAKMRGIK